MMGSNKDGSRSTRPSAEDYGWSYGSGTRWPGDAVYGLYRAQRIEERRFLG
jgi:hypothetical protein